MNKQKAVAFITKKTFDKKQNKEVFEKVPFDPSLLKLKDTGKEYKYLTYYNLESRIEIQFKGITATIQKHYDFNKNHNGFDLVTTSKSAFGNKLMNTYKEVSEDLEHFIMQEIGEGSYRSGMFEAKDGTTVMRCPIRQQNDLLALYDNYMSFIIDGEPVTTSNVSPLEQRKMICSGKIVLSTIKESKQGNITPAWEASVSINEFLEEKKTVLKTLDLDI